MQAEHLYCGCDRSTRSHACPLLAVGSVQMALEGTPARIAPPAGTILGLEFSYLAARSSRSQKGAVGRSVHEVAPWDTVASSGCDQIELAAGSSVQRS